MLYLLRSCGSPEAIAVRTGVAFLLYTFRKKWGTLYLLRSSGSPEAIAVRTGVAFLLYTLEYYCDLLYTISVPVDGLYVDYHNCCTYWCCCI